MKIVQWEPSSMWTDR